jgi:Ser/Thr protein kinase RdoA (MazF antagonist)
MTGPQPSELSPQALISEVLANYNFTPPAECTRVYSGCNDIYLVKSGNAQFILKIYRAGWKTRPEVMDEIESLLHLGRQGAPVSRPIARRDGAFAQTLSLAEGEREAVLFAHARGEAVTVADEAFCRLFGRTLADLHLATDDFTSRYVRYDPEHLLVRPIRALEPLLEDRPADRNYLRRLAQRIGDGFAGLPEEALDWGFCHGDYRPANVHLDGDTGITVFDWEVGGMGFRAYDIAVFRFFLSSVGDSAKQERLWAAYLSGYAECRPLRGADLEALPLLVPLRPIWILGTLLQTARKNWNLDAWDPSRAGPLPNPAFFDQVLRFLRAWDAGAGE